MNNMLIKKAIKEGRIDMTPPLNDEQLQIAQYRLTPSAIRYWIKGESKMKTHDLVSDGPYTFQPSEYAIVIVKEHIVLKEESGVVGRFIPASGLIEAGFGITVGKLDPGYGEDGSPIVFGLKNLQDHENEYRVDTALAHIEFFDISLLPVVPLHLKTYDKDFWLQRVEYLEEYVKDMKRMIPKK